MNLRRVPPALIQGFAVTLAPYMPGLTAEELVQALAAFDPDKTSATSRAVSLPGRGLTPRQAAERLGVSRAWIFKALRDGRLPRVKLSERKTVIPEVAIVRLMEGGVA